MSGIVISTFEISQVRLLLKTPGVHCPYFMYFNYLFICILKFYFYDFSTHLLLTIVTVPETNSLMF